MCMEWVVSTFIMHLGKSAVPIDPGIYLADTRCVPSLMVEVANGLQHS
jgi:hypothetical protein